MFVCLLSIDDKTKERKIKTKARKEGNQREEIKKRKAKRQKDPENHQGTPAELPEVGRADGRGGEAAAAAEVWRRRMVAPKGRK